MTLLSHFRVHLRGFNDRLRKTRDIAVDYIQVPHEFSLHYFNAAITGYKLSIFFPIQHSFNGIKIHCTKNK